MIDTDKARDKAQFYFVGNVPIHITDDSNEYFWGYIIESPKEKDYIRILDKRKGDWKIPLVSIERITYYKGDPNDLPKM